ncbi:MAG: Holliday junction resolvase Hjc [Nanoarchaeota archaeon]
MSKSKGTRAERELFHMFWDNDWYCLRTAGSGSTAMPAPDLIAGKDGRLFVLECKSGSGDYRYLTKKEVKELIDFAVAFKAEPWIGARFDREGWFFVKARELESSGNNFVVNLKAAKEKGLKFADLVGNLT